MRLTVLPALVLLTATAGIGQTDYGLLPQDPSSDDRWIPIEALKGKGPALAEALARHR